MQSVEDFVAAVDAFIAVPKILVGASSPGNWQPGRDEDGVCLKFPLQIGGEQAGHSLLVCAYPNHLTLKFMILLQFFDFGVSRLDFDKNVTHTNNFLPFASALPRTFKGPHWHSWEINRERIASVTHRLRLWFAVPFVQTQQFDAAFRWFCAQHQIELRDHGIIYPIRTKLL